MASGGGYPTNGITHRMSSLNNIPGWHAARSAINQVIAPRGSNGKDLDRKQSGEGLPLLSNASAAQQRRQHAAV